MARTAPRRRGPRTFTAARTAPVSVSERVFPATRWSLLARLADGGGDEAIQALETLCRTYREPLLAYLRFSGWGPEDAEDLVQGFLAQVVRERTWSRADAGKGRLRTFLLRALQRYAARQRRDATRLKRGAGSQPLALHELEESAAAPLVDGTSPEQQYDRAWTLALLEQVLRGLRQSAQRAGKGPAFKELEPFIAGAEPAPGDYARIAEVLGVAEASVRSMVHRFRLEYRERLLQEVEMTLAPDVSLREEVSYLISLFQKPDRGGR